MTRFRETNLHCAVLANDLAVVKALSKNEVACNALNSLGFTALELAHYLGKDSCARILSSKVTKEASPRPKKIAILKQNSKHLELLSPAQFKAFFNVNYRAYLYFPDYLFFQEILKDCPWILRKSFLGEENRNFARLYKNEILQGTLANVIIQWIDETLGYGLFAAEDLPANTYIGEFTGLVRRLSRRHSNQNAYCFHYPTRFWSWNYTIVDALMHGNETRFINHSDTPNLHPLCLCERNLLHLVFITNRPIHAGEQLTYDYGKDFWQHRKKIPIN